MFGVHTPGTLAEHQNQVRQVGFRPELAMPYGEARPQDMAIWRAILAGREGYVACPPGKIRWWRKLALYENRAPRGNLKQARRAQASYPLFQIHRVVLFTHPFTGGRAVFSEPVD